jgi:hypothetical protein
MPYAIRKSGSKFQLVKESTGEVMGTHTSKASAEAQRRAIHANEGKRLLARKKRGGGKR